MLHADKSLLHTEKFYLYVEKFVRRVDFNKKGVRKNLHAFFVWSYLKIMPMPMRKLSLTVPFWKIGL
jgi:hypothetical protein